MEILSYLGECFACFGELSTRIFENLTQHQAFNGNLHSITVFILACFVGYYVVWKVTPALHAPLMAVTNAISSVIIVSAIFATSQLFFERARIFGFFAVMLLSVNIFGGFIITQRMLNMFGNKK